jgi:membrane protein implicated in regulation of membrane protease activity
LPMSLPIFWVIVAIVMGIVEIFTVTFGFMLFGIAALITAVVAAVGFSWTTQVIVFALVSVLSLWLLRPRLIHLLHKAKGVPTRTEALVGESGRVTETIEPGEGRGRVMVAGQDWAARSSVVIPAGVDVVVKGADGIVLIVDVS